LAGSQPSTAGQTARRIEPVHESGRAIDRIPVGRNSNWVGFSPDGGRAVVSNTSSNDVSIIDVAQRKVVATVPVGKSSKRLAVGAIVLTHESVN
jgi:YVTN family beta-propeller protein